MPKSNIQLLNAEQRRYFNSRYSFEISTDYVLVKTTTLKRITTHKIDEGFALATPVRKVFISTDAINMWKDNFINTKYTLIDVQNAVNALIISYQNVDKKSVMQQLKNIEDNDNKRVLY